MKIILLTYSRLLYYSSALIYVFKADLLLVGVAVRHDLLIFVLPDKLSLAKLLKVLIVIPELEVFRLSLESGHLVEDAHVCGTLIWAEML